MKRKLIETNNYKQTTQNKQNPLTESIATAKSTLPSSSRLSFPSFAEVPGFPRRRIFREELPATLTVSGIDLNDWRHIKARVVEAGTNK